jgi:NNP family nitrate/nitrite transporter-like MFS transporter
LIFTGVVSLYFSLATSFSELLISRLLMGCAGAGFVVGIKMIAEWFPPDRMGTAQGIYAGWGNFGAAAALFVLPPIAALFTPELGWRVATAFSGFLCFVWAAVYHRWAHEVPGRAEAFPVGLGNTIEVTSRKDLVLQILLMIPVYSAIGFLVWKLESSPAFPGNHETVVALAIGILGLFIFNVLQCIKFNWPRITHGIPDEKKYAFSQVVILCLVYALTFGSQLAVVSMFPEFLENTFQLAATTASILGSSFVFSNLVTRPAGGWLSDKLGRQRVLFVLVLGSTLCYGFMGEINAQWPIWLAIGLAVLCSVLIQAGCGACFAMVPLIRKDLTGKLAGVVGAYGNVGAVFFLTLLSVVEATTFFQWIGVYAFLVLLSLLFLQSFKDLHHSYH